jgi:two-component system chemotaxis response regulator CheB
MTARARTAFVIGASAGGVEALGALLPALPKGFPGAVLVVVHVPRDRPSLLTEVFAPRCALEVREAADKEPVRASTVYFAPSDYHLLVETDRDIALSVDDPVNFSRPSIDVLFETAAVAYGERLMAIVLTGGNDDGARGLEAVVKAGGTAIVQDPATAKVPQMPQAALERVRAHQVLALEAMPRAMMRFAGTVTA